MLCVGFMGTFPASLVEPVRRRLSTPCEIVVSDEVGLISRLSEVDVLVTMALTREIGRSATQLKLVQVPGAGLDRIDRSQLRAGLALANAYGHEAGIAEYVMGTMIALTRSLQRLDQKLRAGQFRRHTAFGSRRFWPNQPGSIANHL